MKKVVALLMTMAMVFSLAACGNDSGNAGNSGAQGGQASGEKADVSLRMWGAEEDQAMLQGMIDSFKEEYSQYANFNIELGVKSEADAKDDVLTDAQAAADVYALASDQIPELVKAGALQALDTQDMDAMLQAYAGKSIADIKNSNIAVTVEAATYNDTLYAFPFTPDGYFLFYDKNVVSDEQAGSWDTMLEAAAAGNKKVGMTLASGWYNASFFYGAGFTTGLNDDGTTAIDWNGTADCTGVQVVQAMLDITGNSAFLPVADGDLSNQLASGDLCAIISGAWDATTAQTAFGDGYAASKLPTFTVDGKQIQQGSVSSSKLVAVNAHAEQAGWATLLAEWITNEENQTIRFEKRELAPSNLKAGASDAVAANVALSALNEQAEFGVIQMVGGKFWDPTATFGEMIAQGKLNRNDEAAIQAALDTLVEGVTAPVE